MNIPKEQPLAEEQTLDLTIMTADLAAAYLASNALEQSRVSELINGIYAALSGLGQAAPAAEPEKPRRPIGVRASIKPEHLISMIDGKPYKTLRRHLTKHGLTPDEYRTRFDLPRDYPMVASGYAEMRRALAKTIGLGRKPAAATETTPAANAETSAPKRGRKPKASAEPQPARKPRPRKAKTS